MKENTQMNELLKKSRLLVLFAIILYGINAQQLAFSSTIAINFQPADFATPDGYLVDEGLVYNDNGDYKYGWDESNADETRDRGEAVEDKYNTLCHFNGKIWEIKLANGSYDILLVCGDAGNLDQINNIDIEGTAISDPDGEDNFDEYTLTVEVSDGKLTLKESSSADNAKICFIEISEDDSNDDGGDSNDDGGSSGETFSTTIQAENVNVVGDGSEIAKKDIGNNGTGYVNFADETYIEFQNIDGGNGGTSILTLRYALGSDDRTGELSINGVSESMTMNATDAWDVWETMEVSISLNAGTSNTIRIESTGDDYGNLDEITIVANGSTDDGGSDDDDSGSNDDDDSGDGSDDSGSDDDGGPLDPSAIAVNFQTEGYSTPSGYLADEGLAFGNKGDYKYGWDSNYIDNAKERDVADIEAKYNTCAKMNSGEIWEIELENGTYNIYAVFGDAENATKLNNVDIEGTVINDNDDNGGEDNFDEYTLSVEITDGRLTIKEASDAGPKICFIEITVGSSDNDDGSNDDDSGDDGSDDDSGDDGVETFSTTIQAENVDEVGGGSEIVIKDIGNNGTGYADFDEETYIEFQNIDGGDGGTSTLTLRYALGPENRTGELTVNGVSESMEMNATGAWDVWGTMDVSISLNAGTSNTIRIASTGDDYGNLDEITIVANGTASNGDDGSGDDDSDPTYILTVNEGSGNGTYENGTLVTIIANNPATNYEFDAWTGDVGSVANVNAANTTLTISSSNISITATYSYNGGDIIKYALNVIEGTGNGDYKEGASIEISADSKSGYDFDKWTGDVSEITNINNASTTLSMPAQNVNIAATYTEKDSGSKTYTLTVNSGSGAGSYKQGQIASIIADSPLAGKEFDKWTGDTEYLSNVGSSSTSIFMPSENISVTATYKINTPISSDYTLTVYSGTGGGSYRNGDLITIFAEIPQNGFVFDKWTGDISYLANVSSPNIVIEMPNSNIRITATYKVDDGTSISENGLSTKLKSYPNPFIDHAIIRFSLIKSGLVTIEMYNLAGHKAAQITNQFYSSGTNELYFSKGNLSSGMYLLKMTADDNTFLTRIIVK